MNTHKFMVPSDVSIIDAMRALDQAGKRILLIVENKKLLGVLTDGDIRRFILKNGDLNDSVSQIMNREPSVIFEDDIKNASTLFEKYPIAALPVIDEKGNVVDVLFWENVFGEKKKDDTTMDTPIVIMAGGRGTRLYPYTKILPKPLIPIGDTPIVERIINRFVNKGCSRFYLTVNYKKNMIRAYFNEIDKGYSIDYVEEDKPLGTAGSLHLLNGVIDETFIVSNCDIIIDEDYFKMLEYHKKRKNKITIITSLINHTIPYGVIEIDDQGNVNKITEKPEYNVLVNTGMYILEPEALADIPQNEFYHITDLIEKYTLSGEKVGTYPVSENSWLDMGQFSEMERMLERLGLNE